MPHKVQFYCRYYNKTGVGTTTTVAAAAATAAAAAAWESEG